VPPSCALLGGFAVGARRCYNNIASNAKYLLLLLVFALCLVFEYFREIYSEPLPIILAWETRFRFEFFKMLKLCSCVVK